MNRDDCYSATHPSEHNAVHIIGKSACGRDHREAEWRRRREKEGEKIGKGKRNKNAELEERYLRGRSHDFPFLMPVPKIHGYGCPHAQRSYTPACAVVSPLPICSVIRVLMLEFRVYSGVFNAKMLYRGAVKSLIACM